MKEFEYMNECTTRDVLSILVEQRHLSIAEAMDVFYNSNTFSNLNRPETGLYFQSPVYIYSVLEHELSDTAGNGA